MSNLLRVKSASYVRDYIVDVMFSTNVVLRCNLADHLNCEAFEHLKDESVFKQFKIDLGTVVWPEDIDIAPEFLYKIGETIDGSKKPPEPDYVKWTA